MDGFFRLRLFAGAAIILAAQLVATGASADDASDYFKQGVSVSKQGEYAKAVFLFEMARETGNTSTALTYNLGVAWYKTKAFAKAIEAFDSISRNKKYASLAHYNLGLIGLRQDDFNAAQKFFRMCYLSTKDNKLKALSLKAYKRAGGSVQNLEHRTKKKLTPWHGSVSMSVVGDSNVNKDEENLTPGAGAAVAQSGVYSLAEARISGVVSGTRKNGIQVDASAYIQRYQSRIIETTMTTVYDSSLYEYSQYGLKASKTDRLKAWETRYGLAYDQSDFGGSTRDYQDVISVDFYGKRYIDQRKYVRATYKYSEIEGASDRGGADPTYKHLTGSRQKAKLDITLPAGKHRYRLGFATEWNNREDSKPQPGSNYFRSYSAIKNTLLAGYQHRFSSSLRANIDAEYRKSTYNDPDVQNVSGEYTRKDNRNILQMQLNYRLAKKWRLNFLYKSYVNRSSRKSRTDNLDNTTVETLNYDRYLLGARLRWTY